MRATHARRRWSGDPLGREAYDVRGLLLRRVGVELAVAATDVRSAARQIGTRRPSGVRRCTAAAVLIASIGLSESAADDGLDATKASAFGGLTLAAADAEELQVAESWQSWQSWRIPSVRGMAAAQAVHPLDRNEVHWAVKQQVSVGQLAFRWGMSTTKLRRLNPGLPASLPPGAKVRVYRADKGEPARSVGAPNRGRLIRGIPMNDGPHWKMSYTRRRVYGTQTTIGTLTHVLEAYGREFPSGPRVRLGDISARHGGAVAPHRSHQSGRDVDLGFVLRGTANGRRRITTASRFDAEKNWFLVRTLIDSGVVQSIFISARVQPWLRKAAAAELSADEVDEYFEYITHQHGHRNHMHVRFDCDPGNKSCQSHSIPDR